uniref:Uncharacterized protein n=1 Tax=Arundo donax TaxID=35708 RepID=A0A0A9CTH7_ARUDO
MQKQLEALSFLDKRKATKPKLVADQVPSVSSVPAVSDQVVVPLQQQTSVTSPSKIPPVKATKRVGPVSQRLYTILETLLLCEWKVNISACRLIPMFAVLFSGQEYEELCCNILKETTMMNR